MKPVKAIVIGAGLRGSEVYGAWARAHPDRLRIVGVADPARERRDTMAAAHGIAADGVFDDWKPLLARARLADAAIVAAGDTLHVEPALAALAAGYHVLLEKPIAPDARDCVRVVEAAERAERILQIAHVLRFSEFYRRAHEVVASGRLGEIVHVDMREHIAHWHMTHSYVRGKFRCRTVAAPILLAKSCHDLDLLLWLVDDAPVRVTSLGGLTEFRPERAPEGAPERCSDGCPVQDTCIHDAVRFYAAPDDRVARMWPWSDVSADPSREARQRALASGPYGRCVYRSDNDALDHQTVSVEFAGGATASFGLHGLATHERRTLRVSGTRGELRGILQEGVLEVTRHGALETEVLRCTGSEVGHFGGDVGLVDHFVASVAAGALDSPRASGRIALASHLLGFAAERARETGCVVDLASFRGELGA